MADTAEMPVVTQVTGHTSPAGKARVVTPSDSTIVNCRALWVGGAGNVAAVLIGDTAAVTFTAVPAGTILPIACSKIMATNTTATLILALN
jgi:hypothetical protein